jgi:hypothetical protein
MCPSQNNVTLYFSLPDNVGNETLTDHISVVDVMVYNTDGTHVLTKHVDQSALAVFQGVNFFLPAGTYHLECWGNVLEKTKYNNLETYSSSAVTYSMIDADNKVGQSDRVYHAGSLTLTIPPNEEWEGTVLFHPDHRLLEVYIKGYDEDEDVPPNVECTGLPSGLLLQGAALPTSYSTVSSSSATGIATVQGQQYAVAQFLMFRFEMDNSIAINIINPVTGETVVCISLREAMQKNVTTDTIIVRIVIEFNKSVGVTVTIPDWNSDDVGFDFRIDY